MSFSLNEIDAQAKKAARGAGYSWGLAEEAGKATVWLCARGVDGVAELAALLEDAPAGPNCALTQGTRLSDRALLARPGKRVLHRISRPLFLLPFLGLIAERIQTGISMSWDGGSAKTDGQSLALTGNPPNSTHDLTITDHAAPIKAQTKLTRATPDDHAWATLASFAHRTYAPATEESRRLGAGDSQ
ncbi:MAG: DUF3726 domain-containing protein [Cognatishimia sp.]|nr:DUF3726 domain-containing protein [Cognatishimia sp.]